MFKSIKFFNPKKTKTQENAARSSFSYFPASFLQKLQVSSRNSSPESRYSVATYRLRDLGASLRSAR
ncbi:hypothetical protein HanRHA438_Chr03g0147131 [Helianthus annuus]|nr:hypothetical protein HanRHA438_Chr03g0147131 [Helianthus annuus]